MLNRETPLYQYALLNLAILEHKFGHKQKALAVRKWMISVDGETKEDTDPG
jgi:hypothetical protein